MDLNDSKQSIEVLNVSSNDLDKSAADKKLSTKDKQRQQEKRISRDMEKVKRDIEKEEDRKRKEIEKEQDRKRKEIEKEEERKRKEFEKEEERKKKELEKEEERKKKEDEKRKKEEDRRLKQLEKDDEKRKREEEKRLKEVEREEKKRKDEEKRKEESLKKKPMITLFNFYQKEKNDKDPVELDRNLKSVGIFKPIEIKKDMRMAVVERCSKPLINSLQTPVDHKLTYLEEILNANTNILEANDTWPICDTSESLIPMKYKTKSFLFDENVRPPYFGTWHKTSEVITPINPLSEDAALFSYDIDSDQEWVYESGEDISNSEGEVEEEVNDDDDNSFVVPHDYLSDRDGCSDPEDEPNGDVDHVTPISRKRSLSPKSRLAMIEIREKQFQAEVKQKVQIINPNVIGPYFIDITNSQHFRSIMEPFRMIVRNNETIPINCNTQSDFDYSASSTKIKGVPIDAISHLVRLLHHNSMNRVKLCYEFRMFWEYHLTGKLPDVTFEDDLKGKDWDEFTIGKRRLINKIKEIAERKDGKWIVKPETIHEYQLCCADDDPNKECSEKWKYVSNILKIETTKKIPRKSKIVDTENKSVVVKELKATKKRKHTAAIGNGEKLIATVLVADDANEKMAEIKTKKRRINPIAVETVAINGEK